MKINEIDRALKTTILASLLVPIGYLITQLFPQVNAILNDQILPSVEKATLSIWLCIFAYLSILLFSYIYFLRKKIKEIPTLEILQFKKWEEIEKQYEDIELYGHFFHVKKTSLESRGHPQYACPSCYQKKKESFLNYEIEPTPELGRFLCSVCGKRVDWDNFDYSTQKSFPII